MSFIEFLGFIISLAAMTFLMVKRGLDERKRRKNPEAYEEELEKQEGKLRDFLKSLEMDMEEVDRIAPPPPKPVQHPVPPPPPKKLKGAPKHSQRPAKWQSESEYKFQSSLEPNAPKVRVEQQKMQPQVDVHKNAYHQGPQKLAEARGSRILASLPSKKDWIIIQEVLGPPIALRKSINEHW